MNSCRSKRCTRAGVQRRLQVHHQTRPHVNLVVMRATLEGLNRNGLQGNLNAT